MSRNSRNDAGPRDVRQERLSEALKANLKRRKLQQRERSAPRRVVGTDTGEAGSPDHDTSLAGLGGPGHHDPEESL